VSAVVTLSLTAAHHARLHKHLFPGDGKEAAAMALCGRRAGSDRYRLVVRELHPLPYDMCTMRAPDAIRWPVAWLDPLLDRAAAEGLSIVKFHSHPADYRRFSDVDDRSDAALFPGIHAWVGALSQIKRRPSWRWTAVSTSRSCSNGWAVPGDVPPVLAKHDGTDSVRCESRAWIFTTGAHHEQRDRRNTSGCRRNHCRQGRRCHSRYQQSISSAPSGSRSIRSWISLILAHSFALTL
jgi:hypothetical protein